MLKRDQAGRRLRKQFETNLNRLAGSLLERSSFLPLDESDRIREALHRSFVSREQTTNVPRNVFCSVHVSKDYLAHTPLIPNDEIAVFLVLLDSDIMGVLPVAQKVVNQHWAQILDMEPDGFQIVDKTLTCKMAIQWADDGSGLIDLGIWGDKWSRLHCL